MNCNEAKIERFKLECIKAYNREYKIDQVKTKPEDSNSNAQKQKTAKNKKIVFRSLVVISFQQTQLNLCACRYWMLSAYIPAAFWVAMSLALLTLFNLKVSRN